MAEPYGKKQVPEMDEQECCLHIRAIDKLAHELGVPAEVVTQSYQETLADLRKDVNVSAFLPVMVSRCVKARLMQS
jgi:uncharacterized protein (DUF2126 family)